MSATNPVRSAEQIARAQWDLLLLDLEKRAEEVRQIKIFEPRRLLVQGFIAAALLGAGAAMGAIIVKLAGG